MNQLITLTEAQLEHVAGGSALSDLQDAARKEATDRGFKAISNALKTRHDADKSAVTNIRS